jgi:hypothetical protein
MGERLCTRDTNSVGLALLATYDQPRGVRASSRVAATHAERFCTVRSSTSLEPARAPAGTAAAQARAMPSTDGNNSNSYDDIVRKTVVDPDSSARPTRGQEQQAREGFRAVDDDEAALQERVQQALARAGASGVTVEVARERVTLRGRVADASDLRRIEDAVAAVPGVDTVHNQIVVGS